FWPRRSFRRYPGTILVEMLDPIAPGLDRQAFAARLQQTIEEATARLVAEGEREPGKNGFARKPTEAGQSAPLSASGFQLWLGRLSLNSALITAAPPRRALHNGSR